MKTKIHTYEGKEITVTYDLKRCIHAGECVRGLREVFDPQKRRWVQPDHAPADAVADVIERCPTGALHYRMKESPRKEEPSSKNRIVFRPNGPVCLYGNIEVQDAQGNTILEDTRLALCRCGASGNKPACDNSHQEINWSAGVQTDASKMPPQNIGATENHGKLILKLMESGPILLEGIYTIEATSMGEHTSSKNIALCRCGGSSNKPFCDGTHKKIGFEAQ